jgi:hypothetical protein
MANEKNASPEMAGDNHNETKQKPSAFKNFVKKHPVATTVLIGLIAIVTVFYGKEIQGNIEKKALINAANTQIRQNDEALAKLIVKPLVWSIRSEMLRSNMEQVNLLISDLVKNSQIQYIHLLDLNGTVKLSTNKKMEGQPIADDAVKTVLGTDSTSSVALENNQITIISPIMDYDKRLGTLVIGIRYEAFRLNEKNR